MKHAIRSVLGQVATSLGIITMLRAMEHERVIIGVSMDKSRAVRTRNMERLVKELIRLKIPNIHSAQLITPSSRAIRNNIQLSKAGFIEITSSSNMKYYFTLGVERLAFSLKPSTLGLVNHAMSFPEYVMNVISGLATAANVPDALIPVLTELFEKLLTQDMTPLDAVTMRGYTSAYRAAITTEFGEVVGPALVNMAWHGNVTSVFFPASQTMGLYDFVCTDKHNVEHYFSSKALTTGVVNTVKPQDVLAMMARQPNSSRKRDIQQLTEYKILEILAQHRPAEGNLKVISTFPEYFGTPKPPITDAFAAEKLIERTTKTSSEKKINFGRILTTALLNTQVYFALFKFTDTGTFDYEIKNPSLLKKSQTPEIYLRGKGKRIVDERMGLTPP